MRDWDSLTRLPVWVPPGAVFIDEPKSTMNRHDRRAESVRQRKRRKLAAHQRSVCNKKP